MYRYIIMDCNTGPNLLDKLKSVLVYNEKICSSVIKYLLGSLIYCHLHKICHRNIRFENIIFQNDTYQSLKLQDFDCSVRLLDNKKTKLRIGSSHFIAPEIIMQKYYSHKVDIWAVGILLYVMLSGVHPFQAGNVNELLNKTLNCKLEFPIGNWSNISD